MEKNYSGRFYDTLHIENDASLHLRMEEESSGALMLFIEPGVQLLDLRISAEPCSYFKIFLQNRSDVTLALGIHADIWKDAKCSLGLLDLEHAQVNALEKIFLKEEGATFEIFTGQLAGKDIRKISDMEIVHEAPHTYGNMHNFAVQFEGSYYEMVANGNIHDKCPGSESHQETRVLTLGSSRNKVIPLLLIDENDVKASHALTIGRPDEQQMYYLQSRGLSPAQAMGLLSIGYFMPVIELIDDEEKRKEVREEMERKVGLNGYR